MKTKAIFRDLAEMQAMSSKSWVAKQVHRWEAGELQAKMDEQGRYVIEPVPGYKIVVGASAAARSSGRQPIDSEFQ